MSEHIETIRETLDTLLVQVPGYTGPEDWRARRARNALEALDALAAEVERLRDEAFQQDNERRVAEAHAKAAEAEARRLQIRLDEEERIVLSLRDERDGLREALERFGEHKERCGVWKHPEHGWRVRTNRPEAEACDCGLAAALAQTKDEA